MQRISSASAARGLLVGASLLTLGIAAPAVAQSQTPAATEKPPQPGGLGEVVVTAQRRSESAQRAAIPLSVVTPETLRNAGVVTPTALNAVAPAIVVQKAGGANSIFYIRGVGNFTVNAYSDPAVAFNLDGVYLGRPTSTTGAFYDLDRVEALKGPQGTLYGRNATGGAINVIPTKPKYDETSGYVVGGYGSFNAVDVEGAFNAPLGERTALRLSGKVVDSDGYSDDGTNDEVGQAARLQIMSDVTDDLTVRFAADYSHQGGVGPGASFDGVYSFAPGAPATPTSIPNYVYTPSGLDPYSGLQSPASRIYASNFVIGGAFNRPGASLYPEMDNSYWGALAEVTLDTSIGAFTILPAYRDSKIDNIFNGPNFAGGIVSEKDKQFSTELRLQGKRIGPIDWLVGGYYFDEDIEGRYTFGQYQINSFQKFQTGTESTAAFARLTFNVADNFRLVGGLRYTKDQKDLVSDVQTLVEICSNAPPPGGPGCFANNSGSVPAVATFADLPVRPTQPGPANSVAFGTAGNRLFYTQLNLDTSREFERTTYRAAAEFDVSPTSLLYASYETGFRGGGFSNSIGHETYDPEYLKAATIGSKNRFFDDRAQLNIEVFHWKYDNQQVSHFGFDVNNNSSLFTENVARSTIKGFDIDAQFLASENTLLRGNVQYLDNKMDSFVYTTPRGGTNLPPVTGCAVSNGVQGANLAYVIDCSGGVGFNAPEWSVNLGIDQTFKFADRKLVLTADARYRGDRLAGFERLPQQFTGDDTTIDLQARYGPSDDRWFLLGYVRNVTDEVARVATQYSGTTGGSVSTINAPPRTYGVRVGYNF